MNDKSEVKKLGLLIDDIFADTANHVVMTTLTYITAKKLMKEAKDNPINGSGLQKYIQGINLFAECLKDYALVLAMGGMSD